MHHTEGDISISTFHGGIASNLNGSDEETLWVFPMKGGASSLHVSETYWRLLGNFARAEK